MRVMLVDDDPFSIQKLKSRLFQLGQELGHEFEIAAECYSGQSALEQMPVVNPEAVFTDIQMSSINGIELAKEVQKRWPNVPVVIISAYPTFEYAREAMRANVVEYLLKPIDTPVLKEVLQKLLYLNRNKMYLQAQELLRLIISSDYDLEPPEAAARALFPFAQYRTLLIQNVEASYDLRLLMPRDEVDYSPLQQVLGKYLQDKETVWFLPSDDRRSILLIIGMFSTDGTQLPRILDETQRFFASKEVRPTIVYSELFGKLQQLRLLARRLQAALAERRTIGKPQVIALEAAYEEPSAHFTVLDEKRILGLLANQDATGLRNVVINLFGLWDRKDCSNLIVESNMKRIVQLLESHYRKLNVSQIRNLENRIEELVDSSPNMEELSTTFFSLLSSAFQMSSSTTDSAASLQLFNRIELYISANIGQPLSLQVLTDHFHVSRTVICNLFRDYSGKSYVEYITALRMKMAQQLMRDYPEMRNKEIAEIIGYPDQNYFSHVFKTVTEMSPTKYRETLSRDDSAST